MSDQLGKWLAQHGGEKFAISPAFSNTITNVEVLEVWQDIGTGQFTSTTSLVDIGKLDQDSKVKSEYRRLWLRLVYIPLERQLRRYSIQVRQDVFKRLLREFRLETSYDIAHTSPMTFDVLPLMEDENDELSFASSVSIQNFYGLYSNRDVLARTSAIFWCIPRMWQDFRSFIEASPDVVQHPFHLQYTTVAVFHSFVNRNYGKLHPYVGSVELRTGHSAWSTGIYQPAKESLATLSAYMSGAAIRIASMERYLGLARHILLVTNDRRWRRRDEKVDCPVLSSNSRLATDPKFWEQRIHVQTIHNDLMAKRVQNQTQALFHLVTRHETKLSLDIARSMKILAVVTIVFLPGTFVASLFSTSMFEWHFIDGSLVSSQFWIYWVVTLPLTIVTIVLCLQASKGWPRQSRYDLDNLQRPRTNRSAGQLLTSPAGSECVNSREKSTLPVAGRVEAGPQAFWQDDRYWNA